MARPRSWQVLGNELVVVWDDGHESYYPLEDLRRACPCAGCSGEPDLFGRMAMGPKPRYAPSSFQLTSVTPVGNYALQPHWADGHNYGIWTYERLRETCSCDQCRASR
ncbi:MAG TPA: DUF971 domain-containing protein [Thermoanaerobaculia bacterium]|nr:DUF971 domain-containing protein [Thermoanaerobaculia bacterium]